MAALPNIVPVHGAWADGSSWSAVIERLQADGDRVSAPQFPPTSLADDLARLRRVLTRRGGPTLVAGHADGGQIITALGADAPTPAGPALAQLDVDPQGVAWLPEDDFVNHFAADLDPATARVLVAVQQPLPGAPWGR